MTTRRTALKSFAGLLLAAGTPLTAGRRAGASPAQAEKGAAFRKAVLVSMLPKERSYADRFAIARAAGFEGIEMQTVEAADEAAEIAEAAATAGVRIHSVMNMDHWRYPLSSADPAVVDRSVRGMETSLRNAARWGADAVLLVPAVVDAATSYRDAWSRSQRVIRERLLPLAGRVEGDDRGRGGLEQVPAQPAGVRALRGRVRVARSCARTSTSATSSSTAIRRTGSARSARGS